MFEPNIANVTRICELLSLCGWLHDDRPVKKYLLQ